MTYQLTDNKFAEKFLIFVMLSAIIIMLQLSIETWFDARIHADKAQISATRLNQTRRISAITDPQIFLIRRVLPLLRLFSEDMNADLESVREQFKSEYALDLNFYQFNSAGEINQTAPERPQNFWLIRNIYGGLHEQDRDKLVSLRRTLDRRIQFAYGYGKDLNSFREHPEQIIETSYNDQTGFFAWTHRPQGGLVVYCSQLPSTNQIFKAESQRFPQADERLASGWLPAGTDDDSRSLPQKAREELTLRSVESGNFAGLYWVFVNTRSGRTVFSVFTELADRHLRTLQLIRLCFAISLMLLFGVFLSTNVLSGISLKKLVILMFLASAMIPLTSLAFTANENIELYEQIQTNKIRAAQEEALGNIAQDFSRFIASCSTTLLKLTEEPGAGTATDAITINMVNSILEIFPETYIDIRNSAGKVLYRYGPDPSEGREMVLKSGIRRIVERFIPHRLDEYDYSGNPFSEAMVRQDDMGIGTALSHPNDLQHLNMGNKEIFMMSRIFPDTSLEPAVLWIEFPAIVLVKMYLSSLEATNLAIDNVSLQLSAMAPEHYRWLRAPLQRDEQVFLRLAENAWVSGQPQFYRLKDELNGFALAIPANEMPGSCMIGFCTAEPMEEQLQTIADRTIVSAIIALFLIVAIASWILKNLIKPLSHLEQGVKSLGKRNFKYRLPTQHGKDEMSNLFAGFNDMMAESYDLQVANRVQEGLAPASFPKLPDYSIFGMIKSASELGGDCLACQELDEQRVFFLIGDITGHGVGSALIMAFVLAITFHWSQQENPTLTGLCDEIDQMMRNNNTSRMFLGAICGILNHKTNNLELVVKGHIYPMLLKNDGSCSWQGIPAYPLGIGKKTPPQTFEIELEKGDSLLCFTDGFLEGRNSLNHEVGFEGLQEWSKDTKCDTAEVWATAMTDRFMEWCNQEQADDISMLFMTRTAAQENENG